MKFFIIPKTENLKDDLAPGTLNSILKQAGLKRSDIHIYGKIP